MLESINTAADLWALYKATENNLPDDRMPYIFYLPAQVPHILRMIKNGHSNIGSVRYSSQKLFSKGFQYSRTIVDVVDRIVNAHSQEKNDYIE